MKILVTGGAGYIGSMLVPRLVKDGHDVTVLDLFFYGREPLMFVGAEVDLVEGDIRDRAMVERVLGEGRFDIVIHLAAISNDPSSALDPGLTREVNRDALELVMRTAKDCGTQRFIYASSASVYGIKQEPDVHEGLPLEPITDYAVFKAEGEQVLSGLLDDDFTGVAVRAATVCGFSPRLRLDLTINILTMHALTGGQIRVFGGEQYRPNVHIQDLVDFYALLVDAPRKHIQGAAFNVSYSNASVMSLAVLIRDTLDRDVDIAVVPTDDQRSYRLSSRHAKEVLGYAPHRALTVAVRGLERAFRNGLIPDTTATTYRNVEHMRAHPDFWGLSK